MMKTLKVITILALFLSMISCSEKSIPQAELSVPTQLSKSFKAQNPSAKDVKWEKEGEFYAVEFQENGMEREIFYNAKAEAAVSKMELRSADLMTSIQNYISESHQGFTFKEAAKITSPKGIFYEVELKDGSREVELIFDSEGNFVKQEMDEDEDDDD